MCLICCQLLNAQASSTTRAFQVSQGGQGVPGASDQGASAGSPHPYWSCGLRQVKEAGASRAHRRPVSDAPPALPAGSVRGAVEGGGAPWQPHSPHWLCLAGQLLPGGAAGMLSGVCRVWLHRGCVQHCGFPGPWALPAGRPEVSWPQGPLIGWGRPHQAKIRLVFSRGPAAPSLPGAHPPHPASCITK